MIAINSPIHTLRPIAAGLALALGLAGSASAQEGESTAAAIVQDVPTFSGIAARFAQELRDAEEELAQLRERSTLEVLPLSETLTELQKELLEAQADLAAAKRDMNKGALELSNLSKTIDDRRTAATRLTNLFSEYNRNFESRLHVSEIQRYREDIDAARLAPENTNLSPAEVYEAQARIVDLSLARLVELGGGTTFEGSAIDADGIVREGRFVLLGPSAIFRSEDGSIVGTASLQVGSSEAVIQPFGNEEDALAAAAVVTGLSGAYPVDATLGNAAKVEATKETFVEHLRKGGPIMVPLLTLGVLAFLIALLKWMHLATVRRLSRKKFARVLEAVTEGDEETAARRADDLRGPAGDMIRRGVATMRRSRELMEEVMYERVLVTKERVGSWIPFVGIAAAAAPLVGLLGTVTGIINTFAQITIYGSGDVKRLSGGISEALITTKFGLVVAIPSLLLHAYLSRRAKAVVTSMEASGMQFANEVARSDAFGEDAPARRVQFAGAATPDHEVVRGQVNAILSDMLGPLANDSGTPIGTTESRGTVTPQPSEGKAPDKTSANAAVKPRGSKRAGAGSSDGAVAG